MKHVRTVADRNHRLKEKLKESMAVPVGILKERFSKLKRKDEQVSVHDAATEQMDLLTAIIGAIDDTIPATHTTPVLTRCPLLAEFMRKHTQERQYSFQACILLWHVYKI